MTIYVAEPDPDHLGWCRFPPPVRFTVPVCPSTNALFTHRAGSRQRIKTDVYRSWLESAGWHIKTQGPQRVPGSVRIEIEAPVNRKRDLDNISKPTLDLIVKLCLIDDDRWVDDFRVVRVAPGPLMTISIWPIPI